MEVQGEGERGMDSGEVGRIKVSERPSLFSSSRFLSISFVFSMESCDA